MNFRRLISRSQVESNLANSMPLAVKLPTVDDYVYSYDPSAPAGKNWSRIKVGDMLNLVTIPAPVQVAIDRVLTYFNSGGQQNGGSATAISGTINPGAYAAVASSMVDNDNAIAKIGGFANAQIVHKFEVYTKILAQPTVSHTIDIYNNVLGSSPLVIAAGGSNTKFIKTTLTMYSDTYLTLTSPTTRAYVEHQVYDGSTNLLIAGSCMYKSASGTGTPAINIEIKSNTAGDRNTIKTEGMYLYRIYGAQ